MSHDFILTNGTEISHFRIESRLGAGGMGEVYKAHDLTLDRPAAMKVLSPEFLTDGDRVRRFVQEARSASALNHPNIVTIYEIGQVPVPKRTLGIDEDGEIPIHFIAMEYIDGLTLRSLASRGTETTRLIDVMAQVADGLAKAHGEGIVHRDLKPDNIMVTSDGYAKVVDFGLAKLTESKGRADQHRTASGVVMGTAAYMSPEQVQGLDIDNRSDIFSFGAILYELVCGRRPFQSDSSIDTMHKIVFSPHPSLQDIVPWLPESLRVIIDRCLEKEPENRYADTRQIASDLRQVIRQFEMGGQMPMTPERPLERTTSSGGQRVPGTQSGSAARPAVQKPASGAHPSGGLSISGGFLGQPETARSRTGEVARPRKRINIVSWIYRIFFVTLLLLSGYLWYVWPDFAPVETLPLEETPAIVAAREDGPVAWEWLSHDNISPALRRSVVEAMDPDFFAPAIGTTKGNEILNDAAKGAKLGKMPKRVVGMSPISRAAVRWGMLSPSNPIAPIESAAFAIGLERTISRDSILEILLNTARFGDGIFGVEAATQTFFKKSAKSLTAEEAAILAVYLNHPSETNISNPDNLTVARRDKLVEQLAGAPRSESQDKATPDKPAETSKTPAAKPSSSTSSQPAVPEPSNDDAATAEPATPAEEPQTETTEPPAGDPVPDNG